MIAVEQVDLRNKGQVRRFVELPYRLYAGCRQWCPPLRADVRLTLDPRRHPFYDHSEAAFLLAVEGGRDVGRVAVLEHRLYNAAHGVRQAQFYHFECEDNPAAARALLAWAGEWAAARGLTALHGPKGFGVLDGYGVLIDGFEHRQMMSLTHYNPPYYAALLEGAGFRGELDLVSAYLEAASLPPWLQEVAAFACNQGGLRVRSFGSRRELFAAAPPIFDLYQRVLAQNWEQYPLPPREVEFVFANLKPILDPRLVKVLEHEGEMVGLLLVFPDLTPALQRAGGRLTPWSIADLLLSVRRRPPQLAIGVLGVLPQYRLLGGNALLFAELLKTAAALGVRRAELLQVLDTAQEMRRDLAALGVTADKTHRIFRKELAGEILPES